MYQVLKHQNNVQPNILRKVMLLHRNPCNVQVCEGARHGGASAGDVQERGGGGGVGGVWRDLQPGVCRQQLLAASGGGGGLPPGGLGATGGRIWRRRLLQLICSLNIEKLYWQVFLLCVRPYCCLLCLTKIWLFRRI